MASARAAWASIQALVRARPVSALLPVSAWVRGASALNPASASEETASTEISIVEARSIGLAAVNMAGAMSKTMAVAIVFMSGLAATAWADGPGGDACAANLTPDGKAIYAVTVAAKPTLETLRSVVERETRSLAIADKIGRGDARQNAVAAGKCVELVLQ